VSFRSRQLLGGDPREISEALSLRLQASEDRLGTALLLWGLLYSVAVYLLSFRGLLRLRRIQPGALRWVYAVALLSTAYLIVLPLTIGDDQALPETGAFQTTFSVSLQVSGRPGLSATPRESEPRN